MTFLIEYYTVELQHCSPLFGRNLIQNVARLSAVLSKGFPCFHPQANSETASWSPNSYLQFMVLYQLMPRNMDLFGWHNVIMQTKNEANRMNVFYDSGSSTPLTCYRLLKYSSVLVKDLFWGLCFRTCSLMTCVMQVSSAEYCNIFRAIKLPNDCSLLWSDIDFIRGWRSANYIGLNINILGPPFSRKRN